MRLATNCDVGRTLLPLAQIGTFRFDAERRNRAGRPVPKRDLAQRNSIDKSLRWPAATNRFQ